MNRLMHENNKPTNTNYSQLLIQLRELVAAMAQRVHGTSPAGSDTRTIDTSLVALTDELYANTCYVMLHDKINGEEQHYDAILRATEDIRMAIRSWESARQLIVSLRDSAEPMSTMVTCESEQDLLDLVQRTDGVIVQIASALCQSGNAVARHSATRAVENISACFERSESVLEQTRRQWIRANRTELRTVQRIATRCRLIQAAFWSLMVCTESIVRVPARLAA